MGGIAPYVVSSFVTVLGEKFETFCTVHDSCDILISITPSFLPTNLPIYLPAWHWWLFIWLTEFFVMGTILCSVGCLVVPLSSLYYMPVAFPLPLSCYNEKYLKAQLKAPCPEPEVFWWAQGLEVVVGCNRQGESSMHAQQWAKKMPLKRMTLGEEKNKLQVVQVVVVGSDTVLCLLCSRGLGGTDSDWDLERLPSVTPLPWQSL